MRKMANTNGWRVRTVSSLCLVPLMAALLTVLAAERAEAVTATPSEVVIESPNASKIIRIEQGGEAVPADAIGECKLWAGNNDYDYMFTYEKQDGAVTLKPTGKLEIGSYRLVVDTEHGEAEVEVYAPLSDQENIVEKMAQAMGISVESARQRLGLTTEIPEASVSLDLPAVYYEGQTLSVAMPEREAVSYVWLVNGEPVAQGPDANELVYTFTETGSYVIAYHELRDDRVVTSTRAYTMVAPLPAMPWQTKTGRPLELQAPQGYDLYTWKTNGVYIGTGRTLRHTFENPGNYIVTCTARRTGPEARGYTEFRWSIGVTK